MFNTDEYRIQGIFGALHSALIVGGCMMVATVLKVRGYPEKFTELSFQVAFVRNWGFLLILIPLAWVIITIWMERHRAAWFSKRWTIASGVGVGVALGWYLLGTMARAGSVLINVSAP